VKERPNLLPLFDFPAKAKTDITHSPLDSDTKNRGFGGQKPTKTNTQSLKIVFKCKFNAQIIQKSFLIRKIDPWWTNPPFFLYDQVLLDSFCSSLPYFQPD
jgi:hypothetical protein